MRLQIPVQMMLLAAALIMIPFAAYALDHRNLDEGLPLAVEDAYPLKYRECAVHLLGSYVNLTKSIEEAGAFVELECGILRNSQFSVSSEIFDRSPGLNDGSGDVEMEFLYNINTETPSLPAFSFGIGAGLPVGAGDSQGEIAFQGIVTRSFRFHRIHGNIQYVAVPDAEESTRGGRWQGVIGWDHPVGLRTLVIADVVLSQSEEKSASAVALFEAGIRRQLTPRLVFHGAFGIGGGNDDRTDFQFRAGFSRSF